MSSDRSGVPLLLLGCVLATPWLMAPKCVEQDPYYALLGASADGGDASSSSSPSSAGDDPDAGAVRSGSAAPNGESDSGASAGGNAAGGGDDPIPVVPALACGTAGTARIDVVRQSYQISCGCKEASGPTCTVAVGTRVTWNFIDSDEHDISAAFGSSGDRLSGSWSVKFETRGSFPYSCNIHSGMTGYSIVVR